MFNWGYFKSPNSVHSDNSGHVRIGEFMLAGRKAYRIVGNFRDFANRKEISM